MKIIVRTKCWINCKFHFAIYTKTQRDVHIFLCEAYNWLLDWTCWIYLEVHYFIAYKSFGTPVGRTLNLQSCPIWIYCHALFCNIQWSLTIYFYNNTQEDSHMKIIPTSCRNTVVGPLSADSANWLHGCFSRVQKAKGIAVVKKSNSGFHRKLHAENYFTMLKHTRL